MNPVSVAAFSSEVRQWLLDEGSLTSRLLAASQRSFRVEVLSQGVQAPSADESRALGLPVRSQALVREVALWVDDEVWVRARSVIPLSSLKGELGFLKRLQDSALGALLFKDPNLKRSAFEVSEARIGSVCAVGRRSLFLLKGKPLLVAETFMPACRLGQ